MPETALENIGELLESRVERYRNKPFLVIDHASKVFSYREFDLEVNRAASLLAGIGVARGDRVALYLTNCAEYLMFYFACFKLGAWAGPVNALLKGREIEFIITNSEAGTVVTQPDLCANLSHALKDAAPRRVIVVDGSRWSVTGAQLQPGDSTPDHNNNSSQPATDVGRDDEAVIIYTSGTTGKPKGVLLTHGNILSNAEQIARWLRLTEKDRALMIMPLFHVNALMTTCMAALWAGASTVLAHRFSASRHWEIISRYGVTYFGSVATMLSMLNHKYPNGLSEPGDAASLRFALCGSAPVPVEVIKRFESLFNCPVIEGYGLSESTCRSTFNPIDERRRIGSVGLPIGNEMKIFDEGDRELDAGEIGEIVLRGPNVMKGYYKDEAATRSAFRSGWFHTGDLGYRDREGFFYVVDRKSDMIIRGGENIYPREIDEVLYQHPKVKDAATVGVPDPLYGEEVKSFVVPREGESVAEEELLAFCRERLADFKCPKAIEFLDDIPKGPTGKLLKRELGKKIKQ
jgi:long-chain acyl-CoA synthetase